MYNKFYLHNKFYSYNKPLIVIFSFLCLSVFSQEIPKPAFIKVDHSNTEWYLESQKPNPNFYKIKQLFDDFFKQHPYEKSPQKSLMFRWFQVNENNLDAKGNVVLEPVSAEETQKFMRINQANTRKTTITSPYPLWNDMTGSWRMIGPYHGKDKGCPNGYPMTGGFNDRVYINPYNTNNLYAGQSYGGLWVSQDQGTTWKMTDAEFPNGKNTYSNRDVYYGEIEASKTNANLVFAATEAGVLKSTNAGDNWLLVNDLNYTTRSTERAYFVALSNHDSNMLLASYGRKIYRTTDGGNSWTMVFDNSAGGSNYSQGQHSTNGVSGRKYNFAGLAFHPTQNNIAYLAAKNASNQLCIYQSTDYGQTWVLLFNSNNSNPIKMEVVAAAPDKIYLFELFPNLGTTQTRNGIFKYNSTTGALVQALKYPVIGHLLDDCTVSETDSTVMYLGGYSSGEIHKSTNGGLTFATNNPGYSSCPNYVHPDVRGISAVGNIVLISADGGNYISKNGTTTIQQTGKWISAIDLWGFSSAFKGDVVASGDDHGPTEVRWFDGDSGWEHDGGADSHDVTINPAQPRWIYAADVYRKYRMITKDAAYDKSLPVVDATLKYLAIHPNIYGKAFPANAKYLMVSNDNMATTADTLFTFPEDITKVKLALRNPNIFYVLTNKKDVYKSTDSGNNFTKITPSITITGGKTNITDIEVNQDGSMVWLSYGQVQATCKVVKSSDGGTTWANYSTGLPSPTASNITIQRGTDGGVYISTDGGGVWYRDNSMTSWLLLGTGLPMMGYVTSAYVVPNKKAFRMGTARGAFEHELAFNTTTDALIAVDINKTSTCHKDTLYFRDYSAYQGTTNIQYSWTFQGGTPATSTVENPKVLYQNTGTFNVSLTVTDASGNVSTHTLDSFITVTDGYCGPDSLSGKAVKITSQNNYVTAPAFSLSNSNNYTMMAWVKGTGTQASYAGILSASTTLGYVHLNVRDINADSVQLGYHHTNGQYFYNSGLYLKPNTWTHIALVVQPTSISIVKDGKRSTHTGRTIVASDFNNNFKIGTMYAWEGSRNFVGEIDEVAIYKRALTDDEIRAMMHLTKNNPNFPTQQDADLIAYYQFNETISTIYDRIGNKDGFFSGNSISRVESSAPIGGGVSETIASMTTAGNKTFPNVGLTIKLPASGTYPNGAVTAYRIDTKPYLPPSDTTLNKYWIVRNWGTSKIFSALDSVVFADINLNSADLSNPANYRLHTRTQNSHISAWVISNQKALDNNTLGKVWFSGSVVTTFGQFVLSRRANPCPNIMTPFVISSIPKQKIQALQLIDTSGNNSLLSNQKLELSAGNAIILNPNFEIKSGASFKAEIKGCDN